MTFPRAAAAALMLSAIAAAAGAQKPTPHTYEPGIDILDYDFSIDLPDTGRAFTGRTVIAFRRTARVDTLRLDLVRLHVDSVLLDSRPVPFTRTDARIGVPLPKGTDGAFKVTVRYGGAPDDGLIIRTDSAGRWTGFGDNWPNRARHWLPTVDHPSDKATVSWTVNAPANRTVIANGTRVSREPVSPAANGQPRAVTRWRESRPIATYLMVIAAAPLLEYDLGQTACGLALLSRCVPQMVYVAPEQRSELPGAFGRAGDIVSFFAERVGAFPYEKLAHLQSSTRFGGMENATAIFYADDIVRRHAMNEGLIAHETAHQWFGDAVTEREWPHVWLSEGFATYFAALWTQHAHGDSAFRSEMAGIRRQVLGDTMSVAKRPVIDTIETNLLALLNRNSYQKGGFVLHMLRRQLGDRAFFGGLRRYYAEHRDGNALTDDLQGAMEAVSGKRLGWFFDQWLRRPGYPELTIAQTEDLATHRASLVITQGPRFGAYRFTLAVDGTNASGRPVRATFEIPARARTVVSLPAGVSGPLRIDPDVDLLAHWDVTSQ